MTAGLEEIKGAVIFTVRKYYMTHVDLLYIDVCRFRNSPLSKDMISDDGVGSRSRPTVESLVADWIYVQHETSFSDQVFSVSV